MKKGLIGCLVVVGGLLLLALIFGSGLSREEGLPFRDCWRRADQGLGVGYVRQT